MEGVTTHMGQGLYLVAAAVVGLGLARPLRMDGRLGCLIAGVLAGILLPLIDFDAGLRAENLRQLVFFVVLPLLIFGAAWQIEPGTLGRWLGAILLFSTLGVLVCALIIAVITYYGIGQPSAFPWAAALLTGAILAATDPVSVLRGLRGGGAGEDLLTLVEGESLFNDTAAIVLFSLVLGLIAPGIAAEGGGQGQLYGGGIALHFCAVFFGGLGVGLLCGLLAAGLARLLGAADTGLVALVLAAFGSFYVAEQLLGVSGIMSATACAVVARLCLRSECEVLLARAGQSWEWLGLLFTALVFVIMGLMLTEEMFSRHWLPMLIAIAAAVGGRALAIFLVAPLAGFVGPGIPKAWRLLLGWGGLRGVVAVALVLSLPVELPYWRMVQSMVFGVVLFSLLVQGTSSGWLIRKLSGY